MATTLTPADLQSGERDLGAGSWHKIGQREIDLFADKVLEAVKKGIPS